MMKILKLLKRKENRLEKISKQMMNELGIGLMKVSDKALEQYRNLTKDNYNLSDEQIILKLNRNFYCSKKTLKANRNIIIRAYGNMKICVNKIHNEIVNISNERNGVCFDMKINKKLKNKLNKIMEIKNDDSYNLRKII